MARAFRLEVFGQKKLARAIREANRAGRSAFAGAMLREGNRIAKDSVRRTPKDTGALRESIYVRPPRVGDTSTEIGYSAPYAVFVHERTELRHPVGQAKFLQAAINAARSGGLARIGRDAAALMRSGKGIRSEARKYPTSPPPFSAQRRRNA